MIAEGQQNYGIDRLDYAYQEALRLGLGDEMGTSNSNPIRMPFN